MTKFFTKSKKPYFGAILGSFWPNLGKNEFSWKKGPCQFLNIPITYHHTKNQKKLMLHSEKNGILREGQTDNDDFIGPTIGQEYNIF